MAKTSPLTAVSREARAMATQAMLLARPRAPAAPIAHARRVVVLVHGFMAAPAVLDPLADHLRAELDEPVLVYGYASVRSFEAILDGLVDFVEAHVPANAKLALVGHSLGGLVCRAYAQEHDDDGRVERLVTIACPHKGTRIANVLPTALGRALRPGSDHLVRFARDRHRLRGLSPTVIVAEHDHFVDDRSHEPGMDEYALHVVHGVSHNGVLYEAHTHSLVTDALR